MYTHMDTHTRATHLHPHSMAEKYKLLQRANASEQFPFSWKVFASWDYAITGRDTVAGKKKHFAVSLKVILAARDVDHPACDSVHPVFQWPKP